MEAIEDAGGSVCAAIVQKMEEMETVEQLKDLASETGEKKTRAAEQRNGEREREREEKFCA